MTIIIIIIRMIIIIRIINRGSSTGTDLQVVGVHAGAVWDDEDVVCGRHRDHTTRLCDAAEPGDVGLQDVDTTALDQLAEALGGDEVVIGAVGFAVARPARGVADGHAHAVVLADETAVERRLARAGGC